MTHTVNTLPRLPLRLSCNDPQAAAKIYPDLHPDEQGISPSYQGSDQTKTYTDNVTTPVSPFAIAQSTPWTQASPSSAAVQTLSHESLGYVHLQQLKAIYTERVVDCIRKQHELQRQRQQLERLHQLQLEQMLLARDLRLELTPQSLNLASKHIAMSLQNEKQQGKPDASNALQMQGRDTNQPMDESPDSKIDYQPVSARSGSKMDVDDQCIANGDSVSQGNGGSSKPVNQPAVVGIPPISPFKVCSKMVVETQANEGQQKQRARNIGSSAQYSLLADKLSTRDGQDVLLKLQCLVAANKPTMRNAGMTTGHQSRRAQHVGARPCPTTNISERLSDKQLRLVTYKLAVLLQNGKHKDCRSLLARLAPSEKTIQRMLNMIGRAQKHHKSTPIRPPQLACQLPIPAPRALPENIPLNPSVPSPVVLTTANLENPPSEKFAPKPDVQMNHASADIVDKGRTVINSAPSAQPQVETATGDRPNTPMQGCKSLGADEAAPWAQIIARQTSLGRGSRFNEQVSFEGLRALQKLPSLASLVREDEGDVDKLVALDVFGAL